MRRTGDMVYSSFARAKRFRRWLCASAMLLLLCASADAQDSGFVVQVTQEQGGRTALVSGAAVCFVTPDNRGLTRTTDSLGRVVIERPPANAALTVLVGKQNFITESRAVTLTGAEQSLTVALRPGTPTPFPAACSGRQPLLMIAPNPRILSFKIESNADETTTDPNLTLLTTFDIQPRFFRVSESRDFTGAEWQTFNPSAAIRFRLDATASGGERLPKYGTRTLFLQVKPGPDNAGLSNIAADSVIYAPTKLKTFTLTGDGLRSFLSAAREKGYRFTYTPPRPSEACPGNLFLVVVPSDLQTAREREDVAERILARFEAFDGPDFNSFWRIKELRVKHPGFINSDRSIANPKAVVIVTVENPQPGKREAAKRVARFERIVYKDRGTVVAPLPGSPVLPSRGCAALGEPEIDSLTLEGPDDLLPILALPSRR